MRRYTLQTFVTYMRLLVGMYDGLDFFLLRSRSLAVSNRILKMDRAASCPTKTPAHKGGKSGIIGQGTERSISC